MQSEAHLHLEVRPHLFLHLLHLAVFENLLIFIQFGDDFKEAKDRKIGHNLVLFTDIFVVVVIIDIHGLNLVHIWELPDAEESFTNIFIS